MKKVRIYVAASILTMMTAVVFARSSRFISQEMYASTSNSAPSLSNSVKLTETVSLVGFSTTGSNQSQITNNSSTSRFLYAYDGVSFTPLYALGW